MPQKDMDADVDQLLQHIAALTAKLSVTFEKSLAPLAERLQRIEEALATQGIGAETGDVIAMAEPPFVERVLADAQIRDAAQREAITAAKVELQTELANVYQGWSQMFQMVAAQLEALGAHDSPAQLPAVLEPVEMLPQLVRERVDELNSRFTSVDWSLHAIGKGVASLTHEVGSIREEITALSIARRTLSTIEDLKAAVDDIARDIKTGTANDTYGLVQQKTQDVLAAVHAVAVAQNTIGGQIGSMVASHADAAMSALGQVAQTIVTSLAEVNALQNEIGGQIGASVANAAAQSEQVSEGRVQRILEAIQTVNAQQNEIGGQIGASITSAATHLEVAEGRAQRILEAIQAVNIQQNEIGSQIGTSIASAAAQLGDVVEDHSRRILEAIQTAAARQTESGGQIGASIADGLTQSHALLERNLQNLPDLLERFASSQNEMIAQLAKQIEHAAGRQVSDLRSLTDQCRADIHLATEPKSVEAFEAIESAALQRRSWVRPFNGKRPRIEASYDPESFPDQLEELDRVGFKYWKEVLDAGTARFMDAMEDTSASWRNPLVRRFRDYLSLFAEGNILDVGCGPNGDPAYLDGFPADQITGLEPLTPNAAARFDIVKGVNEFLPWAEGSFRTVVNVGSLTQVMNLKQALAETHRVLEPSGLLVLWYVHEEEAVDFFKRPSRERKPANRYQLFQLSDAWFQPALRECFDLVDMRRFEISANSDNVFAVYRPKPRDTASGKPAVARPTRNPVKSGKKTGATEASAVQRKRG